MRGGLLRLKEGELMKKTIAFCACCLGHADAVVRLCLPGKRMFRETCGKWSQGVYTLRRD